MSRRQAGLGLAVLLVLLAAAQIRGQSTQPAEGKLKEKVTAALKAIGSGKCPEDIMGPLLRDQCELQIQQMRARLSALGEIRDVKYKGLERFPNGVEAEVYRANFAKGSMTWMAASGPSGKLLVFWSPG